MGAVNSQLCPSRVGFGGVDLKKVWDDSKKTPLQQIDDYARDIFADDATARQRLIAGERVVVATLISSLAVVATGGLVIALPLAFVPFLMPLVGAVANVAVDEINDALSTIGLHRSGICDHPELQPKTMDDGTWLHYPGRLYNGRRYGAVPGNPLRGWGTLGLNTVTPSIDDYPQIKALNVEFDINRRVLDIPPAYPGSFLEAWYAVYAVVKECNYLQPCSALSSADADKQEEAAILSFVVLWNRAHSSSTTITYPAAANPGDDKTLVKHAAFTINTGASLPKRAGAARLPPLGTVMGGGLSTSTSTGMSTAGKIAVGTSVAAAGVAAAIGVQAWRTHRSYGAVASQWWRATGGRLINAARRMG